MAEEVSTSSTKSSSSRNNNKWQGSKDSRAMNMDSAKEALNTVSEKASEFAGKASEYMSGFDANPVKFVREYPIQAAIGGIVIGFLLGTAVSRRTLT